jgi:hypothetical protein
MPLKAPSGKLNFTVEVLSIAEIAKVKLMITELCLLNIS